jgi:hypothetical protein
VTRPSSKRVAEALLETFSQDEVPADSKARVFAAFGVAAGVTGISTVATGGASGAATAAVVPAAAALTAKTAATVGAFSVLKAVIIGAVAGVVAVQASDRATAYFHDASAAGDQPAVHLADKPNAPTPLREGHDLRAANPATPAGLPVVTDNRSVEPFAVDPSAAARREATISAPAPSARARSGAGANVAPTPSMGNGAFPSAAIDQTPTANPNAVPTASAPPTVSATLTGEIARLDRARAALREGASVRALRELDSYDAEFASGNLRQEAAVLRIEVLVEMGDNVRAHGLARAFADTHPTSGYLAKIRELLARAPKRAAP